jgi:rubredoxin
MTRRYGMDKWECTVCGYIYDPAVGDPSTGIKARTAFEDLPDGWTCPDCGASKDLFEQI